MAMLDVTVVNVALADIQREFGTPLAELVWTVDAYTLTYASALLLGGALADRIGAKRTYMLGLLWFMLSSALCGLADSAGTLISARLLQGIGAALFVPASLSLLGESFPDRARRMRLLGVWGGIIGAAAGSGPLVGGALISWLGWRSIFLLNLPIGMLGLFLAYFVLLASPRKSHRVDLSTHGLLMSGLAGLSFVLIEGPSLGWLSMPIGVSAAVALLCGGAFFRREFKSDHPVIPRQLVANSTFVSFNVLGFIVNFILFGEIFFVSLYLSQGLGQSALETGLKMLPMMAMLSLLNFCSGFLTVRFGLHKVLVAGFGLTALGSIVISTINIHAFWNLALPLAVCNAGLGLAIPAVINGLMQEAGRVNANVGAATLNANRQIGALAGVAAVGIVLHDASDWTSSIHIVAMASLICTFLAILLVQKYQRQST
jgi:DHA2 family methylenomycin A resistance protein-like MFS transporter